MDESGVGWIEKKLLPVQAENGSGVALTSYAGQAHPHSVELLRGRQFMAPGGPPFALSSYGAAGTSWGISADF